MNQPTRTTDFCFVTYCLYWATCCQSSSTASTLPSAIAWKAGISVIFVILTVQPRFFSSTYFVTYVFAVEPAHACSFRVTVPHDCRAPPRALPDETSPITTTSDAPSSSVKRAPTRFDIESSLLSTEPASLTRLPPSVNVVL